MAMYSGLHCFYYGLWRTDVLVAPCSVDLANMMVVFVCLVFGLLFLCSLSSRWFHVALFSNTPTRFDVEG